jgi:hypothetical protein
MTDALSPLAAEHGVDLTPLARSEMAFNDMLAAALAHDDAAWDRAKARFEEATGVRQ